MWFLIGWWGYEFIHSAQPIGSLPLACGEEVEKCSPVIGRFGLVVDAVGTGGRVCGERTHTDEECVRVRQ